MIFDFLRNKVIEIKLISPPPWQKICVLKQKNRGGLRREFRVFSSCFHLKFVHSFWKKTSPWVTSLYRDLKSLNCNLKVNMILVNSADCRKKFKWFTTVARGEFENMSTSIFVWQISLAEAFKQVPGLCLTTRMKACQTNILRHSRKHERG